MLKNKIISFDRAVLHYVLEAAIRLQDPNMFTTLLTIDVLGWLVLAVLVSRRRARQRPTWAV